MKKVSAILVSVVLFNLAACSSSSTDLRYLDSKVLPMLEVPPDLTTVDTESDPAFELPAIFSGESDDTDSRNRIPVLANVASIKLEGFADFYWLSLEAPVEELYQLVKDFWASEGFMLSLDEPVIGIMETDWVYNKEGAQQEDQRFFARLFGGENLSTNQDQFRTRISREGPEQSVQIYISHRGTEVTYKLSGPDGVRKIRSKWIFRESEPELEVEMLSRLMIYLGLRRAEMEQQLENVKLFASRATFNTDYVEGESYLLVQGEYSRTWYRTLNLLERMNIEVASADFKSGFISENGVIRVETDVEVEDTGFFSLFSSESKTVKKQVKLILSEEASKTTRISIEAVDGEPDNSPEGLELLRMLYQRIK